MKAGRLYIAGPMTGHPQHNIPAFDAMAVTLREAGYEVVSPAELDDPEDRAAALASMTGSLAGHTKTWGDFLARDVKLLADDGITGIVVLPGWQTSRGARLETFVGKMLCGMRVYRWDATYGELTNVRLLELAKGWLNKNDISFQSPEQDGYLMNSGSER